jgi:hypothetical protein
MTLTGVEAPRPRKLANGQYVIDEITDAAAGGAIYRALHANSQNKSLNIDRRGRIYNFLSALPHSARPFPGSTSPGAVVVEEVENPDDAARLRVRSWRVSNDPSSDRYRRQLDVLVQLPASVATLPRKDFPPVAGYQDLGNGEVRFGEPKDIPASAATFELPHGPNVEQFPALAAATQPAPAPSGGLYYGVGANGRIYPAADRDEARFLTMMGQYDGRSPITEGFGRVMPIAYEPARPFYEAAAHTKDALAALGAEARGAPLPIPESDSLRRKQASILYGTPYYSHYDFAHSMPISGSQLEAVAGLEITLDWLLIAGPALALRYARGAAVVGEMRAAQALRGGGAQPFGLELPAGRYGPLRTSPLPAYEYARPVRPTLRNPILSGGEAGDIILWEGEAPRLGPALGIVPKPVVGLPRPVGVSWPTGSFAAPAAPAIRMSGPFSDKPYRPLTGRLEIRFSVVSVVAA